MTPDWLVLDFDSHAPPTLVFYTAVGGAGLLATLSTRFPPLMPATRGMPYPEPA